MITMKILVGLSVFAVGASNDNNVEWNGVSHVSWLDRLPVCPVGGETFEISFQTYHFDIASARVFVNDGSGQWIDAWFSHNKGPYDVWKAQIPATAADSLSYYIELTDGTDTDYLSVGGMSEGVPGDGGWLLDYLSVSHAPIGATLTSTGAAFKVWAPGATSAAIRGQFNNWNTTALSTDGNYWWGHVAGAQNMQNYKFYFNGSVWQQDARYRYANVFDNNNSVLVDPTAYAWGDDGFTPPAFEDLVIYELHVGTFSGRNDGLGNRMGLYRDIVDTHLDHLLYLGVNAIELLPTAEFNGFNSWGYNPVNQWGVEESNGSVEDFKYMVDKLHQAGIAVISDVVYNHFSNDGNFLYCYESSQPYYDGTCSGGHVDTPWGAQADFDRWEVRDYFIDNVLYWMDEYHLDGFRMDATRYMRDNFIFPGGQPSGWSLMQEINDEIDRRAVHKISIAEELPNSTAVTNPTSSGGAGFDSQWHDAFIDNVRQELADAAFGAPEMFKIRDAINDSSYPNKTRLVRYVEGHDEAGNEVRLPRLFDSANPQSIYARGRSKLAQGLAMLAPGIPMFFQGGEWIEEDGFDSQFANRLDWNKATSRANLVRYFHDLIRVRRGNCSMRSNAGFNVYRTDDVSDVIVFQRWVDSGNQLVVVASANNNDLNNYRIGFPAGGAWYEILNSQAVDYDGNGSGNGGQINTEAVAWDGMNDSAAITVPQMGLLVFRYNDPPGRSTDLNGDSRVDLYDYYLLQQQAPGQGCDLGADFNEDGRISAGDVEILVNSLTGP